MTVPSDRKEAEALVEDLRDWPRDDIYYLSQLTTRASDALAGLLAVIERYENALELIAVHNVTDDCTRTCTERIVAIAVDALEASR